MTAQAPDLIWIDDGPPRALHCTPDPFGPEALQTVQFKPRATMNHRGYRATWQLKAGVLYLASLWGTVANPGWRSLDNTDQCTLTDIYGTTEPIKATWVDEDLLIPEPERLWEHMYGAYLRARIRSGIMTGLLETVDIKYVTMEERIASLRQAD